MSSVSLPVVKQVLRPVFLSPLRKYLEVGIAEQQLRSPNSGLISNIPKYYGSFETDILYPILKDRLDESVSLRLSDPRVFARRPEVAPFITDLVNFPSADTLYITVSPISDQFPAESTISEVHKRSKARWRRMVNHPLRLKQSQLHLDSSHISYVPSLSSEESQIIEETFIREVSVEGSPIRFVCNVTSVNACLGVLLHDSIHSVGGHTFLKLHPSIAPIQVSLATDPEIQEQLYPLMDELLGELNRAGHRVSTSDSVERTRVLEHNDLTGVPFTVLFTEESVAKGIVGIRDRNTHFVEPVNIRNVAKWLKLNLLFAS